MQTLDAQAVNRPLRRPRLLPIGLSPSCSAVALLAPGGRSEGVDPMPLTGRPALRMYPFLLDLARAGRRGRLGVAQLAYRVAGYNDGDPLADLEWALDEIARITAAPVCLVGHSMGARAALRAAGHPSVAAVVALAPWTPDGEPVGQLARRTVVLAHGSADRVTDPHASLGYALRARPVADRLCRLAVSGAGHALLRRGRYWQSLVRHVVLASVGLDVMPAAVAAAFALDSPEACDVRV